MAKPAAAQLRSVKDHADHLTQELMTDARRFADQLIGALNAPEPHPVRHGPVERALIKLYGGQSEECRAQVESCMRYVEAARWLPDPPTLGEVMIGRGYTTRAEYEEFKAFVENQVRNATRGRKTPPTTG